MCRPRTSLCGRKPLRSYAQYDIVASTTDRLEIIVSNILILIGDEQGSVTLDQYSSTLVIPRAAKQSSVIMRSKAIT
jgi:hypothetical protein